MSKAKPNGSALPAPAVLPSSPAEKPADASSAAPEKSAAEKRHNLYFFLFFWLPLITLFVFAILKGRGE